MPSCVFKSCKNHDKEMNKSHGISFHRFPSNEVRAHDWIALVREERSEAGWMPSKNSRICSVHFKSTDKYTSDKGFTLLKNTAVPVIEEDFITYYTTGDSYIHYSRTGMDEIDSSKKIQTIQESSRELTLRRCVDELKSKQKILQRRNKVLVQKNKRLQKRIGRMSVMLKGLKTKDFISKGDAQLDIKIEVMDLTNSIHVKIT